MIWSCKILLNTIDKVRDFVNTVSGFDVDMYLKSGPYVIDAKSILAIFSLDLSRPMELEFKGEDCAVAYKLDWYLERIKGFVV